LWFAICHWQWTPSTISCSAYLWWSTIYQSQRMGFALFVEREESQRIKESTIFVLWIWIFVFLFFFIRVHLLFVPSLCLLFIEIRIKITSLRFESNLYCGWCLNIRSVLCINCHCHDELVGSGTTNIIIIIETEYEMKL